MLVWLCGVVQAGIVDKTKPRKPQSDGMLCQAAITAAEKPAHLPPLLLGAIGLVESGRTDPRTGQVLPWPWSINVAGDEHVYETRDEAISAVQAAQASGIQSIDVGCMQINLMYHPEAFTSLEQAFDPQANATYAAAFLHRLYIQTGDWRRAAAFYHSQTPGLAEDYADRVMGAWPLAAQYVLPEPPDIAPFDPLQAFTPEMRRRLAQNAADRARWVSMGLLPQPVNARMIKQRRGFDPLVALTQSTVASNDKEKASAAFLKKRSKKPLFILARSRG